MNENAKKKLARIMEIQGQLNGLEQELADLLADRADTPPRATNAKEKRRGRLTTKAGSRERAEHSARVREVFRQIVAEGRKFSGDSLERACHERGLKVTRMQASAFVNHAIRDGRIVRLTDPDGRSFLQKSSVPQSSYGISML